MASNDKAVPEMPDFLKKIMQANKNVICTASADDVRKVNIDYLMGKKLRIPMFQRQYCWNVGQWRTLLADALSVASRKKQSHSLGRLTCVFGNSHDERLVVVDGQQRNTSATLLLAAIRDIAHQSSEDCSDLVDFINSKLFPDTEGLKTWIELNSSNLSPVEEGIVLPFACLVPTYCDRASYYEAILPPRVDALTATIETGLQIQTRPLKAKQFFVDSLSKKPKSELEKLTTAILFSLEWLFFPINMSNHHKDGTEDLQVIYERLALRDAMFCRPQRKNEHADMGAADFVRNLMLGSFSTEEEAITVYKAHWLPIELAAAAVVDQQGIADVLESMLTAFLDAQPKALQPDTDLNIQMIGGQLYARFRAWVSKVTTALPPKEGENTYVVLLIQLKEFALQHYEALRGSRSKRPLLEENEAAEADNDL